MGSSARASTSSLLPRVLVVDPDPALRALHRTALAPAGCDVVEATDGRDALVKALVRQPSLVITELNLPFIDGVALCTILRRDRVTAAVPILVVTSDNNPARLEEARAAGANVLLVKPALPTRVLEEVQSLLESGEGAGRAARARRKVTEELQRSAARLATSADQAHKPMSREHTRFTTTTPPLAPPALRCPECDRPLHYKASHIGGVSVQHPEQWDYFVCEQCGEFSYRQRTRRIRRLP